jgi:hypothetical protein
VLGLCGVGGVFNARRNASSRRRIVSSGVRSGLSAIRGISFMSDVDASKLDIPRQTLLEYAIAFLREADEIRMPALCGEAEDGGLVVMERQLVAIIRRSGVADGAASALSPPDLDLGTR